MSELELNIITHQLNELICKEENDLLIIQSIIRSIEEFNLSIRTFETEVIQNISGSDSFIMLDILDGIEIVDFINTNISPNASSQKLTIITESGQKLNCSTSFEPGETVFITNTFVTDNGTLLELPVNSKITIIVDK